MKLINKIILKNSFDIAKSIKAGFVFVHLDVLGDYTPPEKMGGFELVVVSEAQGPELEVIQKKFSHVVALPSVNLGRTGLVNVALAYAIFTNLIKNGDKVVFVAGNHENKLFDRILYFEIGKEYEGISSKQVLGLSKTVNPAIVERLLNLAMELAAKGREGKRVGTIFVVGDHEKVLTLSKQLIINPFKGYEAKDCNILNPDLQETIREFSALDGAFIIAEDGTLVTAGRYLGASGSNTEVQIGLGSRHVAAAGITALTNALAIVISESTGNIRVFKEGKSLLEIERP